MQDHLILCCFLGYWTALNSALKRFSWGELLSFLWSLERLMSEVSVKMKWKPEWAQCNIWKLLYTRRGRIVVPFERDVKWTLSCLWCLTRWLIKWGQILNNCWATVWGCFVTSGFGPCWLFDRMQFKAHLHRLQNLDPQAPLLLYSMCLGS